MNKYKQFLQDITVNFDPVLRFNPDDYGVGEEDVCNRLWYVNFDVDHIRFLPNGDQNEDDLNIEYYADDPMVTFFAAWIGYLWHHKEEDGFDEDVDDYGLHYSWNVIESYNNEI